MRRPYLLAGAVGLTAALAAAVWWITPSPARSALPAKQEGESPKSLPLTQVILFNSGVGYFQREGTVDGNARIDMSFPVNDVNDLLKSVLLEDLGGGKISAVSYDSQEPIEHTLKAFALDLTSNPSFGQILNQARGEKVEVTTKEGNAQPANLSGVIVGMESQMEGPNKEIHQLNLLCSEGMRCVPLSQVQRIRFLNANLDAEFRHALDALAGCHDSRKKAMSFSFNGEGRRDVKVGYAVENPIWKASYRLKFDKDGKLMLQSWAVVENTTDEDWKDVRLALVAARPISFVMDLYEPLFVPRPKVEPELFASLRPPTFNGSLISAGNNANLNPAQQQLSNQLMQNNDFRSQAGFNPYANLSNAQNFGFNGNFNRYQNDNNLNPALINVRNNNRLSYEELQRRRQAQQQNRDNALKLGSAIAAVDPREMSNLLEAQDSEDSYQYLIEQKVTVPRQKSAMLPIFNQEVKGTRVSIFNERVQNKHPLLGVRFKNTTNQPLMQGPVMVHDGGRYAGDARILDMQPNEERLIAYAIDQGTEVLARQSEKPEHLISAKVVRGVLHSHSTLQKTKTYHIKNRSKQDRVICIEHPFAADWKLVSKDKPYETSRDLYRFEVKVPSGQLVQFDVVEEKAQATTLALTSMNEQSMRVFINYNAASPQLKDALKKAVEMRQALAVAQGEVSTMEAKLKTIVDDQGRLRANIERVPKESEVYKRYLAKFDTQETQIEKFQAELDAKKDAIAKQQKEFESYLVNLNIE